MFSKLKEYVKSVLRGTPQYGELQAMHHELADLKAEIGQLKAESAGWRREEAVFLSHLVMLGKAGAMLRNDILTFQFEDEEIKFYLPEAVSDIVQQDILSHNTFFELDRLQECRRYIKPGSVIVDAGANIGNHSVFFSKFCRAETVYAFEPLKTTFAKLQKNLELNGISNVKASNVALGEEKTRASISCFNNISIGSTVLEFSESGRYETIPLDSLELKKLDFLKIDVEGSQLEVLRGSVETLKRCSPVIWIEMLDEGHSMFAYDRRREIDLPSALLKENGYVLEKQLTSYDYLYVRNGSGA